MKSKVVVNTPQITQGVYVPEASDVPAILSEAEEKATHLIPELGTTMTAALATQDERGRIVTSFAYIVALAALANVNLSFQCKAVQEALHELVHRHSTSLRQFFFENGVRDADVLMEKHGADLMGGNQ